MTTQLPPSVAAQIKLDAERNFNPDQGYMGYNSAANRGYVKGATDYALKAQVLVEALEKIQKHERSPYVSWNETKGVSTADKIVMEALKQYNESI